MLHKAEEWNLISRAPKIRLMKEHGRSLRLDDVAERKLLAAVAACQCRKRTDELFRDIVILMRDTGMRNQRETLPHTYREPRLGEPGDLRAG